MKSRLGWLGPAIVLVGAAVACLGGWYVVHARPSAGPVIDTIPIDDRQRLVIRGETSGDRAFIELHDGADLKWQALIPHYAGRPGVPGVAWGPTAVSVRVIRDHHAELFALAMHDASKLGGMRLAPQHPDLVEDPSSPVTITDHIRSYEIVSGADWHQLVAIDLASGKAQWLRELGPAPIRAAGIDHGAIWIDQGSARRFFAPLTGAEASATSVH